MKTAHREIWEVFLLLSFVLNCASEEVHTEDTFFTSNTRVSTNASCQADITRICKHTIDTTQKLPDLAALECILNQKREETEDLTDACNHVLWSYRMFITSNNGFKGLVGNECSAVYQTIPACWNIDGSKNDGGVVNCLIDKKEEVEKGKCRNLLTRLESVIFSDFEIIERFASKCSDDITKFKCGRNDHQQHYKLPHSQGKTIECLSEKIQDIKDECAVQILRIAELQADDFHLDRAVFFACRDDREKFCERIAAGHGKVYKCLMKHKMEVEMSSECRYQLLRREKIGWRDFKASGIKFSCKDEIKKYRCKKDAISSDATVRLSQVLLCLENVFHQGSEIGGTCMEEIKLQRISLMQDYRVTPELMTSCTHDIEKFCKGKGANGKTFHCLMDHAQSRNVDEKISSVCRVQLENIMKISDIASDWQVDPVLRETCGEVVEKTHCGKLPTHKILDCLMNVLVSDTNSPTAIGSLMTDDCENTLLQIQYFLARDFSMDYSLYEACATDAKTICNAKADWADDPKAMDPARGPIVLSCLFRNIGGEHTPSRVSPKCTQRVKQTMRQRALSVKLIPEIEEACIDELSDICLDKTGPGEELKCLQDNLDDLDKNCYAAVANFTQVIMRNPTIDPLIWKHCNEEIHSKCAEDMSDEDDLLDCLIDSKHDIKNKKCKANILHLQLLELKDIKFSPRFKSQCEEFVRKFCFRDNRLTPSQLVHCLSEIIRDDVVEGNIQRVSKGCRKQVRYLILSEVQVENKELDSSNVYHICKEFTDLYCGDVKPGSGRLLECLRKHRMKIKQHGSDEGAQCAKTLLKVEQESSFDPSLDVVVAQLCHNEIQYFCPNHPDNLLICLKLSMHKEGFEPPCAKLVRDRLIEQSGDSRLSPRLHKACKLDVPKFCNGIEPGEGRVMKCLKTAFSNPKVHLTDTCKRYIEGVLEDAAKSDVRYDSNLYSACKSEIASSCKDSQHGDESDQGKVEECLKILFQTRKILDPDCRWQVAQLVQSTQVDIHVDPLLNEACAMDLIKFCDGIPPGDGRLVGCLLNQLEDKRGSRLSKTCHTRLSQRSEMFALAGSPYKMDSIQDLVSQVKFSPQRNYFLLVTFSIVGLIFVFGLFCGRATKRKAGKEN